MLSSAPLTGIRVVEFAGLAPGPFCGRILTDWGASVIRVDKPHSPDIDRLSAGKRSIIVNSKTEEGVNILKNLCNKSDVLIDPYRPGVLEKLGLGPTPLRATNPKLVYTRITGYGQTGPYKAAAGHDINYLAMSGILATLGRKDSVPTPPVNLLADFAGGGLMAAFGIVMALLHRTKTGKGQVVDCSMTESAAYIGSFLYNMKDMAPIFGNERGCNWLDSGSHFYDTYETSDGKHMAVGAVEPHFYEQLLLKLGLDSNEVKQYENWDESREILQQRFKEKTQKEWCDVFEGSDACVTPVLGLDEAPLHPQHIHRDAFGTIPLTSAVDNQVLSETSTHSPNPAPLLSESPAVKLSGKDRYPGLGQHSVEILLELGYSQQRCQQLLRDQVVIQNHDFALPSLQTKL